ncbi:MAG: hypothetical protein ACRDZR_11950, partial [Acidimicrobiales bacterium]
MTRAAAPGRDAEPDVLSLWPEAERAWDRLRAQMALQAGFWLGYVLCDDRRAVTEMQRRAARVLRSRALTTQVLAPATPDDLVATAAVLVDRASAAYGLTWVAPLTGVEVGGPAPGEEAWDDAWSRFLSRLNEHREGLLRTLTGGLVIAGPRRLAGRLAFLAPDLWTFRSVLVVVGPGEVAGAPAAPGAGRSPEPVPASPGTDPFAWVLEAPLDRRVEPSPAVAEHVARAERLRAAG